MMRNFASTLALLCLAAPSVLGAAVDVKPNAKVLAERAGLSYLHVGRRISSSVGGMKASKRAVAITLLDGEDEPEMPEEPVEEDEDDECVVEEPEEEPEMEEPEEEPVEESEIEEPVEEPEEEVAPADPIDVNAFVDHVTYSGSGCPEGSLTFDHDYMQDIPLYRFTEFYAFMGADPEVQEDVPSRECQLDMFVTDIPEGHRFVIKDTVAEGYIFLQQGITANFTTDMWWEDNTEEKAHNMKYWPNFDREIPVEVNYMTSPFMLDAAGQDKYASACPVDGPGSGTLHIKFRIGVETLAPDHVPAMAEVSVFAMGVTNALVPCE